MRYVIKAGSPVMISKNPGVGFREAAVTPKLTHEEVFDDNSFPTEKEVRFSTHDLIAIFVERYAEHMSFKLPWKVTEMVEPFTKDSLYLVIRKDDVIEFSTTESVRNK